MGINWNDKRIINTTIIICSLLLVITAVIFWKVTYSKQDEQAAASNQESENNEVSETEEAVETATDGVESGEDTDDLDVEPDVKELPSEIEGNSAGIDVSQFQGAIDWEAVSQTDIEFAMIRIGNRNSVSGEIEEDECARYNLQEATANGIMVGAYFVSTAITEEEALEEVTFLCDILDGYGITYPVVYDCEGFASEDHRQYSLSVEERTDLALLFLEEVEARGYVGMFYASSSDIEYDLNWVTSEIELKYRVWVAQYKSEAILDIIEEPVYQHEFAMWQYTQNGEIDGITESVDLNTAYFSCSESAEPIEPGTAVEVELSAEIGVYFQETNVEVTPKEEVNVRSSMDQSNDSNILGTITNGTIVTRTGIGNNGWSRIIYNGEVGYVVSDYVTTDLSYTPPEEYPFNTVFSNVSEIVTAKDVTNLRDIPSVESPSEVIYQLENGETATRTGVSNEGWSRVTYKGETLYCISSYLEVVE